MVLSTPATNIKNFIITKPPLVLFTICLMGFAVTTFSFAYYVGHGEKMPNIDAERDLNSLLGFISKRKLCVGSNMSGDAQHPNVTDLDEITVFVRAQLDSNSKLLHSNYTHIQGYVITSDWTSECTTKILIDKLKISFSLPTTQHTIWNGTSLDICVSITGPRMYLAPASKGKKCEATNHITGYINEKITNCEDGVIISYSKNAREDLLLNLHDRSIINLHLFHTSYFLLVMAITLICYAMIKGKTTVKHQAEKLTMEA